MRKKPTWTAPPERLLVSWRPRTDAEPVAVKGLQLSVAALWLLLNLIEAGLRFLSLTMLALWLPLVLLLFAAQAASDPRSKFLTVRFKQTAGIP